MLKVFKAYLLICILFTLNSCYAFNYVIAQPAVPFRGIFRQGILNHIKSPKLEKTINIDGFNTRYLEAGQGEVIILLHGTTLSGPSWYPIIDHLAKKYRVIAPDMIGHGESDKPDAPYTRAYFAKWLKEFMAALNIDKATMVGSSLGGAIATEFALTFPDLTHKLILVNSSALNVLNPGWGFLKGLIGLHEELSIVNSLGLLNFLVYDLQKIDLNMGIYTYLVIASPDGAKAFKSGGLRANSQILPARLKSNQVPTLLLWGADDEAFPLKHAQESIQWISNSELVSMPDTKHLPFFDKPAEFSDIVLKFLKK